MISRPAFLLFIGVFLASVLGLPAPGVRKEWRSLSDSEKAEYIKAVRCLQEFPSKVGTSKYAGAVRRYDDYVLTHVLQTPNVHYNGQFLPWHRYFTWLFETALREECQYRGYQPYWDETLDIPPKGSFVNSPVFDPVTGFGGNGAFIETPANFVFYGFDMTVLPLDGQGSISDTRGNARLASALPPLQATRTGGGCVQDGPFKGVKIRIGPWNNTGNNERCLNRDFAPAFAEAIPAVDGITQLMRTDSFANMTFDIEPIHGVGHTGAGGLIGEMFNPFSSPNDPLFYLHHANVDRIWWNWQQSDVGKRFRAIEGYAYLRGQETVNEMFPLQMGPVAGSRPIQDFFNIRDLGYVYDDSK